MEGVRFEVMFTRHEPGRAPLVETLSGDLDTVVGWLRATADELLTSQPAAETPGCAEHRLVQHRDGRPPWCNLCRRDGAGVLVARRVPTYEDLPPAWRP